MPNPAWGGQGVLRNMTGTAERYDMGIEVQNNEVAIYVQWYEEMDVNSDECKYRVNGTLPPSVQTISFCFILGSRCSSCLEIPILWQEVGQDLTDSNERHQQFGRVCSTQTKQSKQL